MVVDQHPVLEGSWKRLGAIPVRMDPLHATFQAVDVRLPAPVPQYLGINRTSRANIARNTINQLHLDLGRDRDSMGWTQATLQSNGCYLSRHPQQTAHHPDYVVLCTLRF
ncbi:hypothetical protein F25303_11843 [Fusarium sp. NRRL 25303]|nr:hypothetical protein F25303_11843 [Fusarium sp. NRRL 25303]